MTTIEVFQPRGAVSRRQLVLNELRSHETGETVEYPRLHDILELPKDKRQLVQSSVYQAQKEFLTKDRKGLEAVRSVGYRIVTAAEHMALAKTHQERSSRRLRKAHQYVVNVDINDLSEAERALFQIVGVSLGQQRQFMHRMDIRQKDFEERMQSIQSQHEERTEEQTSSMQTRLKAMEESLKKAGLLT